VIHSTVGKGGHDIPSKRVHGTRPRGVRPFVFLAQRLRFDQLCRDDDFDACGVNRGVDSSVNFSDSASHSRNSHPSTTPGINVDDSCCSQPSEATRINVDDSCCSQPSETTRINVDDSRNSHSG